MVVIPASIREELRAHAAGEAPNECCGVLVFADGVADRYVRGLLRARQLYFSLALVRDIRRPAPWLAEFRLSAEPLPRTMNAGSAIVPGMTPNTPAPAGVAPLRWTISSLPSWASFQAKLWWFSMPTSILAPAAAPLSGG